GPAGGEVELIVERLLLEVRKDMHVPAQLVGAGAGAGPELVGVVIGMAGEGNLLEVVLTLRAGRRFAHLLYRRHEERYQDGDDGDDDQQLDQGESGAY